ncbi:MAG: hypothetical protein LBL59_04925 [Xanthomonadaceae bacterium]|jgi:hypothetical protein|nr:hypothetical protein [Xanthomonadaceae bacterium]
MVQQKFQIAGIFHRRGKNHGVIVMDGLGFTGKGIDFLIGPAGVGIGTVFEHGAQAVQALGAQGPGEQRYAPSGENRVRIDALLLHQPVDAADIAVLGGDRQCQRLAFEIALRAEAGSLRAGLQAAGQQQDGQQTRDRPGLLP